MNNKRKNILFLIEGYPGWGHVLDQARALSFNNNVCIVTPVCLTLSLRRFKDNLKQFQCLPKCGDKNNDVPAYFPIYIDFSFLPWKYRKHYFQIWTMLFSLIFLILTKKIKFDIIHAHFIYRPGYIAAILGKIFRRPVVITAHGSDVHQNLFLGSSGDIFRKRTLAALRWSDRIIAVSEYLKIVITAQGIGKKTYVVPCGFARKLIPALGEGETRLKLSLPMDKKILLFVGNLEPVKGAAILIGAFEMVYKQNPNIELVLVGDGSQKKFLEQQVDACGVAEAVCFLGKKSNQEALLYINAADIVIVPSRDEGRSVVIFEALACGKPVVASKVGGIPETIINEKLGILVEKENPAALAEGINRALIQSWDKKYLLEHALKYTSNRMASEVSRVYDEVLGLG